MLFITVRCKLPELCYEFYFMKLVLKKKCVLLWTELKSVAFYLNCFSLQTKNRTSNECLNISFIFNEIKNVTVSYLLTSAT